VEEVLPVIGRLHSPLEEFALVALWSGLRLFEVAALVPQDVEWLDDGSAVLHVREGKMSTEGWSLLYPQGAAVLRPLWADARRSMNYRLIFRNARRDPWDRKSVNKHWTAARAEVAGQEATKFKTLRAIHATWLLDQGVSTVDVALQLRHVHADGFVNERLVHKHYLKPNVDAALERLGRLVPPAVEVGPGPLSGRSAADEIRRLRAEHGSIIG
jgi:integrase